MIPTIFVRADAGPEIGIGHIMRSLALAQAWRRRGARTVFLSHLQSKGVGERIIAEGFELVAISNPHPHSEDREQLCNLWKRTQPASSVWVVVDGYHFDPSYQMGLRGEGFKLLMIDDLAHQPFYHADILLNQNIDAQMLHYNCGPETLCLMGPKYVLLREEFSQWQSGERVIPKRAKNLLITLGGSDRGNATLKVIRALKQLRLSELEVRIIVGPANPNRQSIEKELNSSSVAMQVLKSPKEMPSLMAWADLAVSAGGSTCWELAFMGVPSLVIILAKNQQGIATGLGKAGVAVNCGWSHSLSVERIAESLEEMIANDERRAEFSNRGMRLVDGLGVERTIEQMTVD